VGLQKTAQTHALQEGPIGNPKGRPKGAKNNTLEEVIDKALDKKIPMLNGGESGKITILEALTLKQVQQGLKGDHKSYALLTKGRERRESNQKDILPPILDAMRSLHEKHEEADRKTSSKTEDVQPPANNEDGDNDNKP